MPITKQTDIETTGSRPEKLSMPVTEAELRVDQDGETARLIGYATKYGNWYEVGGFLERIKRGAFDEVLAAEETDVVASMNHNPDFAFARQSAGTLRLKSNTVGLQYEADITDVDGRRVAEKVGNGTIRGSSFMFADTDDVWEFPADETPKRTITRVGALFELGPVVWPANSETSVKVRADEILAEARARFQEATGQPEPRAETYTCECIECGHTLETEEHCKDVPCPECGGEMRRKERPGPGRSDDPPADDGPSDDETEISPQRQRQQQYDYAEMGRIIREVDRKNNLSPDGDSAAGVTSGTSDE